MIGGVEDSRRQQLAYLSAELHQVGAHVVVIVVGSHIAQVLGKEPLQMRPAMFYCTVIKLQ